MKIKVFFLYKRTKTVVGARHNIQKNFIAVGIELFDNKTEFGVTL